jgi:hypothetical protein
MFFSVHDHCPHVSKLFGQHLKPYLLHDDFFGHSIITDILSKFLCLVPAGRCEKDNKCRHLSNFRCVFHVLGFFTSVAMMLL